MLQLRDYQRRSLDAFESYLSLAIKHGAKAAFVLQTDRQYRSVPNFPDLPYLCLRIPTGGGKTLMACHALGIATRTYLQAERAVCLWLVPSNTIRDQTLASLRDLQHPYRQALTACFSGLVRVMDLKEALYVQRSSLEGETVIIVSTLAALRVEDMDGRKVYEPAGALSHHFTGLTAALEAVLEKREEGTIPHSLANVLRLWRPIVIMDEAHNARTPLSFDTIARFSPSCIIEFTATPQTTQNPEQGQFASNVLHHVSAVELKVEDMVKLPIKLQTRIDWKETVRAAVQMQRTLEEAAHDEEHRTGEYLRPLVLLQAQPRSHERQTLTVEVVKQSLIEDFRIPNDQIAIATGQTREIDDVNLFDRSCPIRFIITVQALKEGWDCSFAYVLCSVAEMSSSRSVEQLLGRILRLPRANKKQRVELNYAYAFAASPRFIEAAETLTDALIENGFQRLEASVFVVPQEQQSLPPHTGTLYVQVSEVVTQPPDLAHLSPTLQARVSYDSHTRQLTVAGPVTIAEAEEIYHCIPNPDDRAAVERLLQRIGWPPSMTLGSGQQAVFEVPCLSIRVGSKLELFDETFLLDVPWNLAECDASLSESEFLSHRETGSAGEVDVSEAGRVEAHFIGQVHEQLAMLAGDSGWTVASLANWLDRQVPHEDIPQVQSSLFMHRVVTGLMDSRGVTVEQLGRQRFRLRQTVEQKVKFYRHLQSKKAYQQLLFGTDAKRIEVSPELCVRYTTETYAPSWYYEGGFRFRKHYLGVPGELKSEGEEFECAVFLDELPEVKYWVRNLERKPEASFWLQTSSDKFYPDFVALLTDGRVLVVEYKNERDWTNDDSKEKRAVGELWTERSHGCCLFVMPNGKDCKAIVNYIRR